jgi:excisionase family DNA binding protein
LVSRDTVRIAEETVEQLRLRGENEQARAIQDLIEATRDESPPSLDLLTSTQAGELLGVSGQTIKNWVRRGHIPAFRVGGRIMVPKDAVVEYVRRAKTSLDLEDVSDDEAARIVAEGRGRS